MEDEYLDSRYTPGYTVESIELDTIVSRVQQLLELANTAFVERMRIIESSFVNPSWGIHGRT
ncbi:hypothetical protein [Dyadobacter bucti]|uniref:hypothetical protein n=1 Tax=Dyadobacter bucti TaxID=2572203 RepID=UPI003F6F1B67